MRKQLPWWLPYERCQNVHLYPHYNTLPDMNSLLEIFLRIFNLFPEGLVTQFADNFRSRKMVKGDFLLREGHVSNELAFIAKGSMMCYYLKDGKRYIDEFSLDYEFITDYSSFIRQSPSDKNIECLEDCAVFCISKTQLDDLYEVKDQPFDKLGRLMAEQIYLQWHEKSKSLLMDDATERYLKLIKSRPHLPQRVPQYLVAEYLGITPESLSRIRKTLAKGTQ
jgi:CRP-like cAMP-binding protein